MQRHLFFNSGVSTEKELKYLGRDLETAASSIRFESPGEDVALFVGMKGSGKSALLSCLMGCVLFGVKDTDHGPIAIKKPFTEPGPEIGPEARGQSLRPPHRWVSANQTDLLLLELPEFEEHKIHVDIVNAFYFYRLRDCSSARLVLVADFSDISEYRTAPLDKSLYPLEMILTDKFADCFSNIVLAITKVPPILDGAPVTVASIVETWKREILPNRDGMLTETGRDFVEHLTMNQHQIGLFGRADIGPIPGEASSAVDRALRSVTGVGRDTLTTLSPRVDYFLAESMRKHPSRFSPPSSFFENLEGVVRLGLTKVKDDFADAVRSEESREKLRALRFQMKLYQSKLQAAIEADASFHGKLQGIVRNIGGDVAREIEDKSLVGKATVIEFVDHRTGSDKGRGFSSKLNFLMEAAKLEVYEVFVGLQLKLREIDEAEAEYVIGRIQREKKANTRVISNISS